MKKIIGLFFLAVAGCTSSPEKAETFVVSDFTKAVFTGGIEGPAVDKDGKLYLVNFEKEGTIGVVDENGEASLFLELPEGSIGNGIRFGSDGNMYIADYTGHNVLKVDMQTREVAVFAHDSTLFQPNDVAIMDNDILFASDPDWKGNRGRLWRVDPDGTFVLLEDSMGTTNGVEVSPDNKLLYVNESNQGNVWAYDLDENGNISNKRLLIKFDAFGMDGMRCDKNGFLYISRYEKGTVAIVSPDGKLVKEIELKGKKPTNVAFGGPEGKTVYVTEAERKLVEIFEAEVPGREW